MAQSASHEAAGAQQGPVSVATFDAIGSPVSITGSKSLIKDIEAGPDAFFVAWEDMGAGEEQVRLAKVTNEVAAKVDVSAGASANWPTVVWNGDTVAVAYYQYRDGPATVYMAFYDGNLQPTNPEESDRRRGEVPLCDHGPRRDRRRVHRERRPGASEPRRVSVARAEVTQGTPRALSMVVMTTESWTMNRVTQAQPELSTSSPRTRRSPPRCRACAISHATRVLRTRFLVRLIAVAVALCASPHRAGQGFVR